jgi:hypothetical protein
MSVLAALDGVKPPLLRNTFEKRLTLGDQHTSVSDAHAHSPARNGFPAISNS